MKDEIEEIPTSKVLLTQDELLVIWQQDEFWGIGGSYDCDPFRGLTTNGAKTYAKEFQFS